MYSHSPPIIVAHASTDHRSNQSMSTRAVLDAHLNDFVGLVHTLVQQISGGGAASIAAQRSIALLLAKDRLLQSYVDKLIAQQRFQRRLSLMRDAVARADTQIVEFATRLGKCEQTLHDAVHRHTPTVSPLGVPTTQAFSVEEVTVFAERLALMSFAPADYIERKGLAGHRPPAPLESLMSASHLHLTVDELLALKDQRAVAAAAAAAAITATTTTANDATTNSLSSSPTSNGDATTNTSTTATDTATTAPTAPVVSQAAAVAAVANATTGAARVDALRTVKAPTGWKPGDAITPQLFAAFMSRAAASSSSNQMAAFMSGAGASMFGATTKKPAVATATPATSSSAPSSSSSTRNTTGSNAMDESEDT